MDASLDHQKNPAEAWDIIASAKTDKGEKISKVKIYVNNIVVFEKSFNPGLAQWHDRLTQKGQYPGSNTSRIEVNNEAGDLTSAEDSWS